MGSWRFRLAVVAYGDVGGLWEPVIEVWSEIVLESEFLTVLIVEMVVYRRLERKYQRSLEVRTLMKDEILPHLVVIER